MMNINATTVAVILSLLLGGLAGSIITLHAIWYWINNVIKDIIKKTDIQIGEQNGNTNKSKERRKGDEV